MYLKKLEMKGFKSFADKTEIIFENGVTCVVGPNGSGKSNITDAVRWVLGEQKIKTLRGSKMEDVIFNGTKRRKPLGYAEVSLFFDNSTNIFPYDFSEIVVSRKLFRSGESEYSLNNIPCKLKEVKELFMDTGIGTDGYSIIGQGRIERILSTNKEERKSIFEEASGIAKYKSRKYESERKLQNTDLNLQRVEDIINELQSRIAPLKSESDKAIEYSEISKKLKEIEINQLINTYERNEKKLENENEKFIELKKFLDELNVNINIARDEYADETLKFEEANRKLEAINNEFFNCANKIKELEGDEKLIEEKIKNKDADIERVSKDIDTGNKLIIEKEEKIITLKMKLEEVSIFIKELNSKKKAIEENYSGIIKNYELMEGNINDNRSKIINILNLIERESNEILNLEKNIESFSKRNDEINYELSEIISQIRDENKNHLKKESDILDINKIIIEQENKKKSFELTINENKNSIRISEENLRSLETNITKSNSEKDILIAMDEDYEGFDNSVRNALKKCDEDKSMGNGIIDVIASLFNVDKKYEKALEVSLGKKLQNIVCENEKNAQMVIEYLKKNNLGRVTFLPISNVTGRGDDMDNLKTLASAEGYLGKANEIINFDKKYSKIFDHLLGRIIIADSYENAINILKIKNLKYKIVTLDGEILVPGGSITGGSFKSNFSNILGRKRKIIELEENIVRLTCSFEKTIYELKELKNETNNQGIELSNAISKISELKFKFIEKNSEINRIKDNLELLGNKKEKLVEELELIEKQLKLSNESKEAKIVMVEGLKNSHENLLTSINNEIEKTKTISEDIENYKNQVTTIRVELASNNEKYSNGAIEIKRNEDEKSTLVDNVTVSKNNLDEILNEKNQLLNEISIILNDDEIEKNNRKRLITDKEKIESMKLLSEKIILNKKSELENLSKNIIEKKDNVHKIDINIAKYQVEKDNIIKEIWDKYQLSIIEALKFKKDDDFKDSIKEVKEIKKRISDLGPINLNSIEEYKEVKGRYDFLCEQKSDLVKAQKSLRKIIKELETLMKEQFLHYFEIIRENFSGIFSELFSGGKADLLIDDMDNILESDISILAQPVGKKLQDLTLMSGGEKALTAITLLFAILKAKPAPFCILDEIEAALDDVNVVRFAEFLKHFTKDSQFVVITHRKGTMDIADVLYGVTMEEHGVSKMVSVKLEDVV